MQLVWDMDGTLLDTTVAVPTAYVTAVRTLGGPALTPDDIVRRYHLGPPEVILADALGRDLVQSEAEIYYDELAAARVSPYPGVSQALAALRQRGHPLVIFTGASSRAASILLAAAAVSADLVIGGDQVERPKPAGDGLELAARQLGQPASCLAYIGDSPNDLRAARAAGGLAVAAAWGHQYDPAEPAHVTLAAAAEALSLLD
jgi:HAD superfamily hydrolase (TIGR01509 family)